MHRTRGMVVFTFCGLLAVSVVAQSTKKVNMAEVRALDSAADKARVSYLRSLTDLVKKYEDAGLPEKSREIVEAILAVSPDDPAAQKKLKELSEAVYNKNEYRFEFDAAQPWANAGILLSKDQSIRFEAEGEYFITLKETLGPNGYTNDDPTKDLIAGIPMGALMGAMAPPGQGRKVEDVKPFNVGTKLELTPKVDGPIFFKVNVPPGAKVTGKVRITIRGNFRSIGGPSRN